MASSSGCAATYQIFGKTQTEPIVVIGWNILFTDNLSISINQRNVLDLCFPEAPKSGSTG